MGCAASVTAGSRGAYVHGGASPPGADHRTLPLEDEVGGGSDDDSESAAPGNGTDSVGAPFLRTPSRRATIASSQISDGGYRDVARRLTQDRSSLRISSITTIPRQSSHSSSSTSNSTPMGKMTTVSAATSSALWMSQPHTMIVLDWDDTLFPTTWLCGKRWFRNWVAEKGNLDEADQAARDADGELLGELDRAVRSFIVAASHVGQVCCVTLARRPWQGRSMQAFYPRLSELWQKLGLQVRYAREEQSAAAGTRIVPMARSAEPVSEREEAFREEGKQVRQKMKAMQKLIRQFYKEGSWKNVVSIGDGPVERQALKELGLQHINPVSAKSGAQKEFRVKTVQMAPDPSCEHLCGQLQVLTSWLPSLVCLDRDYDVDLNASEEDLLNMQEQLADLLEAQ